MRSYLELYYKLQLLNIYKKLLRAKTSLEVRNLYIEYLKLSTIFSANQPLYEKDLNDYKLCNCYCYALGLRYPEIFCKLCDYLDIDYIGHNLGFISQKSHLNKSQICLENLYSDLDVLKIKAYDSSITSENKHDGYKIALYVDSGKDFHLIRQNADGKWSEKRGYGGEVLIIENTENLYHKRGSYEFVKALEIVKPTIRTLKL